MSNDLRVLKDCKSFFKLFNSQPFITGTSESCMVLT